ncbi:MAG: hypothetical protein S4CHLAM2_12090 [Chlamydiales bacterium]|nr:hypothetical protein [Chlamydiales bacterium]
MSVSSLASGPIKKDDGMKGVMISGVGSAVVLAVALGIVTCIAALGGMSGAAYGGSMLGLGLPLAGGATCLAGLLLKNSGSNKGVKMGIAGVAAITFLAYSTLAVLAITGVIASVPLAWVNIGIFFTATALVCSGASAVYAHSKF